MIYDSLRTEMDHRNGNLQQTGHGYLGLLLGLAVVLAILGLMQTSFGAAIRNALGLKSHVNGYTELYIARPDSIPTQLRAPAQVVHLPLVIANRQGRRFTYTWTASERNGSGNAQMINTGSATIGMGQSLMITPTLRISCTSATTDVEITLAGLTPRVDFHATCVQPKTSSNRTRRPRGDAVASA